MQLFARLSYSAFEMGDAYQRAEQIHQVLLVIAGGGSHGVLIELVRIPVFALVPGGVLSDTFALAKLDHSDRKHHVSYARWRPDFPLLFIAITLWNYGFAPMAPLPRDAKGDILAGAWGAGDLAALGYFKYANFGVESISQLMVSVGLNPFYLEVIILPLGISFYTFQAMAYLVDVHRGDAQPTRSFINFAAFISFFPQLIAGPILRYRNLEKQFEQRTHSAELFSLGASRFLLGFIKKALIADSIAPVAGYLMAAPESVFVDSAFSVVLSTLQLYFDFSGYSDMAIGLGMMMGFRFQENFNQPFVCQSVTEFWQRCTSPCLSGCETTCTGL